MTQPVDAFAERLLQVTDEGRRTATYKLALLLALLAKVLRLHLLAAERNVKGLIAIERQLSADVCLKRITEKLSTAAFQGL